MAQTFFMSKNPNVVFIKKYYKEVLTETKRRRLEYHDPKDKEVFSGTEDKALKHFMSKYPNKTVFFERGNS